MRYLLLLCFAIQASAFAQSHTQKIEQHLAHYKQDFLENPNSPLRANDLKNLHFYQPDSTYRIVADVKILPITKPIKLPASSGERRNYHRYATATFRLEGKELQLTLFKSEIPSSNPKYKDFLFLPFTDETSGKSTYGGGRYLDINLNEIKDNKLEIDFNKAYNPYCAYSHGYQCPIPPQENDLSVSIKAGEKMYTGKVKK